MRKILTTLLPGLLFLLAMQGTASAQEQNAPEFSEMYGAVTKSFEEDLLSLSFRYRYEHVDVDNSPRSNAAANTLKTSFTLAPKVGDDWLFLVQIDDVRHLGSDKFNDTRNGQTGYENVVDPEGTGFNQGFIRYTGFTDTAITAGRQAIVRTNKRYVGGVEWRQNEQTYDAAAIKFDNDKLALYYSYIDNVSRIFGPDSGTPKRNLNSKSSLIDGSYTFSPMIKVFGYAYLLDFTDVDAYGLSNETFGLRATGKIGDAEGINVDYQAEFAKQEDYKDNPNSYDANYYLLQGNLNVNQFSFIAAYEVLGGDIDGEQAFQTPLATLHKFQGWADQFLSTPDGGIEDLYIGATAKLWGAKFTLMAHDFKAEEGGIDYGTEIDAAILWKIGKYYSVLLKAASFNADNDWTGHNDTTKAWVQLQASW